MPRIEIPSTALLQQLFALLSAEHPDLIPTCRWLLLGPELAPIVLPQVEGPTPDDLVTLLRLLRDDAEDFFEIGKTLAHNSEHEQEAIAELCVDQLMEYSNWEHPTQILERPRPDFGQLLAAAQARLKNASDSERDAVATMTAKVERAARIAESARVRREMMRRGRRRKRPATGS